MASDQIKAVILDMDGVLWLGSQNIYGSAKATQELGKSNYSVFYCTNNSKLTRHKFYKRLKKNGFFIKNENYILSSSYLLAQKLIYDNIEGNVLFIGSHNMAQEISQNEKILLCGIINQYRIQAMDIKSEQCFFSAAVIGFDNELSYHRILEVTTVIGKNKCPVYVTNLDTVYPSATKLLAGTGSIIAPILNCVANKTEVILSGKPDNFAAELFMKKFNLKPNEIAMIGDNLKTDITFGKNCGFMSILVESGVHKRDDCKLLNIYPDHIIPSLSEIKKVINIKD